MLDNVKIDRESTTHSEIVAKRMKRKEAEIFAELMQHSKHGDHIKQIDEEIARLEDDMLFAELKEGRRRDYNSKHMSTLRAQTLHVPPPSSNVFYRSSSRVAAERMPANIQVRVDDILLERTERAGGLLRSLQNLSVSNTHNHHNSSAKLTDTSIGGGGGANNSCSFKSTRGGGGAGGGGDGPPLPSIDGRSPYRRRGSDAANTSGTTNNTNNNVSLASRKPHQVSKRVADDKLIYNDTPYMLSVGRMRSSSPAALQRRVADASASLLKASNATAAEASQYHTSNQTSPSSSSTKKKHPLGGSLASANGRKPSQTLFSPESDVTAKLSATLLSRTTIDGEHISDSDSDADDHQHETANADFSQIQQKGVPTLSQVNEQPWKMRASHDVLIRDPYMRKYGLHRHNTYLYSEKFKDSTVRGEKSLKRIVDRDGCDFDYRGNIRGEGMQRGNVKKA